MVYKLCQCLSNSLLMTFSLFHRRPLKRSCILSDYCFVVVEILGRSWLVVWIVGCLSVQSFVSSPWICPYSTDREYVVFRAVDLIHCLSSSCLGPIYRRFFSSKQAIAPTGNFEMLKEVVSSSHVAAGKTLAAHSIHIGQTFVHSNLIWYESDHQTHALPSTVIPTVYKYRVSRVLHNCSILLKVLLVLE